MDCGDRDHQQRRNRVGPDRVRRSAGPVNKMPTSIDTAPSTSHGSHIGSVLLNSATVDGFNATGNIRFYLFGPDNSTCNFNQTSQNEPHGWIFMAGPIALVNGKASVPPPGFTATEAGVYQWVADYGGDANNTEALGTCGSVGRREQWSPRRQYPWPCSPPPDRSDSFCAATPTKQSTV